MSWSLSSVKGTKVTTPTIHVLATTFDGTKAALKAAVPLAIRDDARVVLLVAQTVDQNAEQPGAGDGALVGRYDAMVKALEHPVQIRLCMAPSVGDAAARLIPRSATVVIGGRAAAWWPSAEERLAARLRRSGRDVVFVGCNRGRTRTAEGVNVNA